MPRYSETRGRRLTRSEALSETFAVSRLGYRYLLHLAPRIDRFLVPRTHGRWSSVGRETVGMLTSSGAKSGEQRSQPLLCIDVDHGSFLLIGSNYGRAHHPGWTANLRAHPECTLTFRGETRTCRARELEGGERATAWERAVAPIGATPSTPRPPTPG